MSYGSIDSVDRYQPTFKTNSFEVITNDLYYNKVPSQ